jgi:hypothetical protein
LPGAWSSTRSTSVAASWSFADGPSNVCLARSEQTRDATVLTEWTSLGPGRDTSSRQRRRRARELGGGGHLPIEELAGTEHRMHEDGELAGDSDSGAFEADLLA